jgi:hypothetical protein
MDDAAVRGPLLRWHLHASRNFATRTRLKLLHDRVVLCEFVWPAFALWRALAQPNPLPLRKSIFSAWQAAARRAASLTRVASHLHLRRVWRFFSSFRHFTSLSFRAAAMRSGATRRATRAALVAWRALPPATAEATPWASRRKLRLCFFAWRRAEGLSRRAARMRGVLLKRRGRCSLARCYFLWRHAAAVQLRANPAAARVRRRLALRAFARWRRLVVQRLFASLLRLFLARLTFEAWRNGAAPLPALKRRGRVSCPPPPLLIASFFAWRDRIRRIRSLRFASAAVTKSSVHRPLRTWRGAVALLHFRAAARTRAQEAALSGWKVITDIVASLRFISLRFAIVRSLRALQLFSKLNKQIGSKVCTAWVRIAARRVRAAFYFWNSRTRIAAIRKSALASASTGRLLKLSIFRWRVTLYEALRAKSIFRVIMRRATLRLVQSAVHSLATNARAQRLREVALRVGHFRTLQAVALRRWAVILNRKNASLRIRILRASRAVRKWRLASAAKRRRFKFLWRRRCLLALARRGLKFWREVVLWRRWILSALRLKIRRRVAALRRRALSAWRQLVAACAVGRGGVVCRALALWRVSARARAKGGRVILMRLREALGRWGANAQGRGEMRRRANGAMMRRERAEVAKALRGWAEAARQRRERKSFFFVGGGCGSKISLMALLLRGGGCGDLRQAASAWGRGVELRRALRRWRCRARGWAEARVLRRVLKRFVFEVWRGVLK